jgi:hypothetical protein
VPIAPEDRHRYPPHWSELIRPAILRRAWLRCECMGECGRGHFGRRCPEVHLAPSAWGRRRHKIVLTIAHLNHTPEDDRLEVLKAMCQGCHLHYDREHHDRSQVLRWQRAIEAAGQDALFEAAEFADARGGDEACLPDVEPAVSPVQDLWPAGEEVEGMRTLSLHTLPVEARAGLEAAIAMHAESEAFSALARVTLAGALAEARALGAQTNELVAAAGLTKPRFYRLLEHAPGAVEPIQDGGAS